MASISRRKWLKASTLAAGSLGISPLVSRARAANALLGGNDQFQVLESLEICHTLGQHTGVTRLANDDLLFWYGDYTDAMEKQTGYILRSTDNGRSWSDPVLTLRSRKEKGGTHTSLGMQTLRSGRVLAPWYDGLNRKLYKNKYPADIYVLRSDDNGQTWQGDKPQPRNGLWNPLPYGKVTELANGDVLCPAWTHMSATDAYDSATSIVLRSKDQGESFTEYSKIMKHANETDVTVLKDGRLLALLRIWSNYSGVGTKPWTFYAHSDDDGRTWDEPKKLNIFAQNLNAWYTSKGTLVAACRGIDGSGVFYASRLSDEERKKRFAVRHTEQKGYGIHFFKAAKEDGSEWEFLFALPDPAGRQYENWHESGEPCFANLPNGDLFVGFYSYRESIYDTLPRDEMSAHTLSESKRIPHCFKRRPSACIIREV